MPIEKRTRVEVFLPLRSDILSYQVAIDWMAEEFARQRGGATLTAPFAGLFVSDSRSDLVEDAVRILFSDFQLDMENEVHRTRIEEFFGDVKRFLTETLGGRGNLDRFLSGFPNPILTAPVSDANANGEKS